MPETSTAPAVIFFDLDDTLFDDQQAVSAGLRVLMDHLGHPDFTAARRLWDVQTEISFGAYLSGRLTLQQQRHERIRALATQAGHSWVSDEHCEALYQRYLEGHRQAWRIFDDVVPTLTALASIGRPLGVITNGPQALQQEKLTTLGLAQYFATVVCADSASVHAAKPEPQIFYAACQRLNVAPAQCWHVGDQIRADALGALNSGMRPILLDRYRRNELPASASSRTEITTITGLDALARMVGAPAAGQLT